MPAGRATFTDLLRLGIDAPLASFTVRGSRARPALELRRLEPLFIALPGLQFGRERSSLKSSEAQADSSQR